MMLLLICIISSKKNVIGLNYFFVLALFFMLYAIIKNKLNFGKSNGCGSFYSANLIYGGGGLGYNSAN